MSLRPLVSLILLFLLVALTASMTLPNQEGTTRTRSENRFFGPKWEYRTLQLEGQMCLSEVDVTRSLNALGQEGWELVSYEQPAPQFPKEAEGTLLIAPAATGPNRDVTPQTADSFKGSISLKMEQVRQAPGCSMLLKRQWYPPAR